MPRRRQDTPRDVRDDLPRTRHDDQDDTTDIPVFEFSLTDDATIEAFLEILTDVSNAVPDPDLERQRRDDIWERFVFLVQQGKSTGSRVLDRMIIHGIDAVDTSEYVYESDGVPSPEEHFRRQDPSERTVIYRPRIMTFIEDDEFSEDVLDALGELGRTALAGKAVLREHALNSSNAFHNLSTYYLTFVVLNLGNLARQPWFANNKKYPRYIRSNPQLLRDKLVLPYLVLHNPGHVISLCESYDFTLFDDLCKIHNIIGIQCRTERLYNSPPLSLFIRSDSGMIELLHHWDISRNTGSNADGWLIHAVLARCVFGLKTHDVDEQTRERSEYRDHGTEASENHAYFDDDRRCTFGIKEILSTEDQLEDPNADFHAVADDVYYNTLMYNEHFVSRLGLCEIRVLTMHINSYSFHNALSLVKLHLRVIFAKALFQQTDFITGDFNLFCNRQFHSDTGGIYWGGIVVEVLEDTISTMNRHLKFPITYNISSSTSARDVYLQMQEGDRGAGMDCMLCISLFYNKQQSTDRPIPTYRNMSTDYLHNVLERPKRLTNLDLCLRQTDGDWHPPLIVRVSSHSTRNKRTRSAASTDFRYQKFLRGRQQRNTGWGQQQRWHGWYS